MSGLSGRMVCVQHAGRFDPIKTSRDMMCLITIGLVQALNPTPCLGQSILSIEENSLVDIKLGTQKEG